MILTCLVNSPHSEEEDPSHVQSLPILRTPAQCAAQRRDGQGTLALLWDMGPAGQKKTFPQPLVGKISFPWILFCCTANSQTIHA